MLAVAALYPPEPYAGSEVMLHLLLKELMAKRHTVTVALAPDAIGMPVRDGGYEFDGVSVLHRSVPDIRPLAETLKPDVIVAQQSPAIAATTIGRELHIPVVQLAHNTFSGASERLALRPDLVVYNSRWVRDFYAELGLPSVVVRPPVTAARSAGTGDAITLINLSRDKGADLFYALAEACPDRRFLGVVGGYGEQIVCTDVANVAIQPQTGDMHRDVWSRTRILLVPSGYESYGMVAMEACHAGIPVLAHPAPGLLESLAYAGIFIDRDEVGAWVRALRLLDDDENYRASASRGLCRAEEIKTAGDLESWVSAVEDLANAGTWPGRA